MIEAMTGAAVVVVNSRQDILATNLLGRALFAPLFESLAEPNMALHYEKLRVAGAPGLEIFAYMAEPGSRSAESLALLAQWTAPPANLSHAAAPVPDNPA
jgi:hypothetical protein